MLRQDSSIDAKFDVSSHKDQRAIFDPELFILWYVRKAMFVEKFTNILAVIVHARAFLYRFLNFGPRANCRGIVDSSIRDSIGSSDGPRFFRRCVGLCHKVLS